MTKRALAALFLAVLAASPEALLAQARRPAQPQQRPAEPPPPEPESPPPPYEPQLLKLAEIIGSLAYLRTLCEAREAQDWRERMAALLESEGRSPQRRERLASAYNRGYRAYSATHRTCSDGSQEASARLAVEGEKLAKALASRFGG
ncbi:MULTISPECIES: TIGR02301 family protein [unclassified Bosea (in: a-proteobacteria)]|uniref:TIGR02301 family protein n=1 Tax=unclassified Bosea (in: a-proteobacteria) TaxID=2653178 RepID=UPI000F761A58|nr:MULTISPECIES: TIGR02301 family protein [unclassified Bosea (in: a-proteobacteria)]AZO80393.1 TIGR02301 family protein [Bosea sp. Tri-49]RXT23196.1 TIGR02301 family protein [Bosea sp. Tri-39]RXT38668.1 TIGR02301 family protein [Bosea sp. Tri-54]